VIGDGPAQALELEERPPPVVDQCVSALVAFAGGPCLVAGFGPKNFVHAHTIGERYLNV
jgi:hypothetical protein